MKFLTDGKLKFAEMDAIFDTVKLRKNGNVEAFPIEKRNSQVSKTWDTFEKMLKEKFPEEHEAIDKFIAEIFRTEFI